VSQVNRVERLIINLDTAMPSMCAWDDCDKRSRTPYQVRVHEHPMHFKCSDVNVAGGNLGRHAHYAFCSEGCKDLWISCSGSRANELAARNNGRIYGMHSAGNKRMNR
jgi:hypothetical protein